MPEFYYKARDKAGNLYQQTTEALNAQTVAKDLIKKGFVPIEIKVQAAQTLLMRTWLYLSQEKIQLKDQVLFARQMYTLLRAGIPLLRALSLLIDTTIHQTFKAAISKIKQNVESGIILSEALILQKQYFPKILIAMVKVGESSGDLAEMFLQCAIHFEKELNNVKEVKAAMRYPLSVLLVIIIAFVLINIFVVPSFVGFFKEYKTELPLPTRILMTSSSLFINYWPLMLMTLLGIVVWIKSLLAKPWHRTQYDKLILRLPIIGPLKLRAILARFSSTFALCIKAGVPILDALGLVAETADNLHIKAKINGMVPFVANGGNLSKAASAAQIFEPIVEQMISIGEESGELDKLLGELSQFYERELAYDIKKLTDSIEPIMISAIAGLVLILALGIFLPMWDISGLVLKSGT